MDREQIASELVGIAKFLTAKNYPEVLPDNYKNKRFWRALENAVGDVIEEEHLDEEHNDPDFANSLIKRELRVLRSRFREVDEKTIEHYFFTEYHSR